jgi:hypothetical protein
MCDSNYSSGNYGGGEHANKGRKGAALAQHGLLSQLLPSNPPLLKPRPPKHGGASQRGWTKTNFVQKELVKI